MEYRLLLTAIVTYLFYLLGGFDTGLEVLIVMTVIDYITGIIKACFNKCLSSYWGWRGIVKKCSIFLCIIVAVQLERFTGQADTIHNLVAFGFVVNEAISIIENLVAIGVPVPDTLKQYLNKLSSKDKEKGC